MTALAPAPAAAATPAPRFDCPICNRVSWRPRELEERFCDACNFVDDVLDAAAFFAEQAAIEEERPDRTLEA